MQFTMTPPKTKTSDYLSWNDCSKVEQALLNAKQYRIYIYLVMGKKFGLRAKDMLSLRWNDLLNKEMLIIKESKTGKTRNIPIAKDTQKAIHFVFETLNPDKGEFLFKSWSKAGVMSSQYISKQLRYYSAPVVGWDKHISTHSTRKTLGRRVLDQNKDKGYALLMLNEIYNHSSLNVTKRYLGIRNEEKLEIYKSL
jgi:integrase